MTRLECKWYNKGIRAGRTDYFDNYYEELLEDAQEDDEMRMELRCIFWDGYIDGRKQIGRDIYQIHELSRHYPEIQF